MTGKKMLRFAGYGIIPDMPNMVFKIKKATNRPKKITVSFNADKFERIAAHFGMFRKEFIESVERAEKDIKVGKIRKIKSLAVLRK